MTMMPVYSRGSGASNVPRILPVVPTQTPLFSWLKEGNLFYVSFGPDGGGYLYRIKANGALMVVTNDTDKVNIMLQSELRKLTDVELFMKESSAPVFLSLFAPGSSYIIDSGYVRNWAKYKSIKRYGCSAEALEKSAEILGKYASEPKILVNNGEWGMEFYVVLADGEIEQWVLKGHMFPFEIKSLQKGKVEKEGTIVPIPEIGGNIRLKEEPSEP